MKNPINLSELKTQLKRIATKNYLRPDIQIDPDLHSYKNKTEKFFGIHLYWREEYLDQILYSKEAQFKSMNNEMTELFKTLPNYSSHQNGLSDGHLFTYIDLKIQ